VTCRKVEDFRGTSGALFGDSAAGNGGNGELELASLSTTSSGAPSSKNVGTWKEILLFLDETVGDGGSDECENPFGAKKICIPLDGGGSALEPGCDEKPLVRTSPFLSVEA